MVVDGCGLGFGRGCWGEEVEDDCAGVGVDGDGTADDADDGDDESPPVC